MSVWLTANDTTFTPTADDLEERFRDRGLEPRSFSNAPGHRYEWHEHERHKILFCAAGAITFHTREGDYLLEPGDRLDIEPGT
jgi:quercetin dioxygenase-like cupin family protein